MILRKFLFRKPAGDDGADAGGGADDRGDDFVPTTEVDDAATGDEVPAALKAAKADVVDDPAAETDEAREAREEEEAKAAAAAAKGKGKEAPIPLDRHKAILEKERAARADLERQLENYKKGAAVAATNEDITKAEDTILGLEKEYNAALADGKLDEASRLMTKIRHTERQISDQKAELRSQTAEARAYERVRYDNVVDRLEAAYPQFVEGSDEHDPALVAEVLELSRAYQIMGSTPAEALQKAAKKLMPAETKKQERAVETDVKVDKDDVAKALAETRRKEAVERNLKVAGKQPPDVSKVGLDNDKAGGALTARDAIKLSQDDFNKLANDEELMARLRGDTV